jgi:hypothetical protein
MADAAERLRRSPWQTLIAAARRELRRSRCNPSAKRLRIWPASASCPAKTAGRCDEPYDGAQCLTFRCPSCKRSWPWCYGVADTPLCNACATIMDATRERSRG